MRDKIDTAALLLVLAIALATPGCSVGSKQPLGSPGQGSIDPRILGEWRCHDEAQKEPEPVVVHLFRFNEHEYYIELDEGEDSDERLRAYSTRLSGAMLLNLQVLSSDPPRGYYFVSYRLEDDGSLHFRNLDNDKLVDAQRSSQELAGFVSERLGDEALYERPVGRCSRVE